MALDFGQERDIWLEEASRYQIREKHYTLSDSVPCAW